MPRSGRLAIGAVVGALTFGVVLPLSAFSLLAVLAVSALVAAMLALGGRHGWAALTVGVATIALRLLAGGLAADPVASPPAAPLDGRWVGQVVALGSTTGGQQRAVLTVRASDASGAVPGAAELGPWRAYAWLPRYPLLIAGDRFVFDDPLEPVRDDGSEFAGYLDAIDAVVTTRIRDLEPIGDAGGVLGIAESLRRVADESLARVVPEPMAGLASAVLVGRRDRVAREVTDAFTATGLSHVVAISGWNIALIGAVVGGLLAAAGLGRRQRTIGIVVVLGGFTLVAGGGASVVRAALMGGVALVARESGRPGSAASALGLAVWLLLVLDPAMAADIGFQLSVAATAGLLAWGSRLADRMRGTDPGLTRRWLAESLGVSLAAQAATLPLVLFHFGRLSLVSPLANLVVAPIVAPAMLVGFVCLLVGLVVGAGAPVLLAAPFALLGWLVLGAMVAVAGAFAALPFASVELPPLLATGTAAGVAALVLGAAWRTRRRPRHEAPMAMGPPGPVSAARPGRRMAVMACVAAVVSVGVGAGLLARAVHRETRLVVIALDVGQGDSILVQGPRGGRLLLDGGPDPDRLLTVLDRHVPPWDRRIDLVILTHPHEDHVAGLAMLLARYRIGGIAENGMLGAGPGDAAFRERLADLGVATSRLAVGDRLSFDGIEARVVWPIGDEVPATAPSEGRRINDTSVVLDLRFGTRRVLLTGDIEDDVDPRLLAAGISDGTQRLDVLKVAHHGSRTATSDAWLEALHPRVALVSAGTGNPYGHPARRTLERLAAAGARVLRTDLDGDIEVSTDGTDLRIATSGGRPVRTGAIPAVPRVAAVTQGLFLCAIPLPAERLAALDGPASPNAPRGRPRPTYGPPPDPHLPARGDPLAPCYDRPDDHPHAAGSSRTAPLLPAGRRDRGALGRHRGGGVLPRGRTDPRGPPGRSAGDRDGRPAP